MFAVKNVCVCVCLLSAGEIFRQKSNIPGVRLDDLMRGGQFQMNDGSNSSPKRVASVQT